MMCAEQIYKTFNPATPLENTVLRGLSLTIETGQFVMVIGSNGAGKSTLLNIVSGEVSPDRGRVLIDDQDVTALPAWRRAAMVARVFQDPLAGTCEGLTIEENLALAMQRGGHRGFGRAVKTKQRELFRERLAILDLGLENRLGDRMGLLSGGQRQAVSLLMASLRPSRLLLLDEHTAALDPKTAAFILSLTDRIVSDQKLTVLMVTHSMRQALEYGHRTIMLHQGQVVLDVSGEPRSAMQITDLLAMFEKSRGGQLDDDTLLLS
ncbi:MAG: ABC transporter ATP-binding protein [Enterobacteriaceae bacterium]